MGDLSALIGVLAVVEGDLMAGELPAEAGGRIRQRLETESLLAPGGSERDLRQAINDLNQRLRFAIGEQEEPVTSMVPE